jgi:hypothetical protein
MEKDLHGKRYLNGSAMQNESLESTHYLRFV